MKMQKTKSVTNDENFDSLLASQYLLLDGS